VFGGSGVIGVTDAALAYDLAGKTWTNVEAMTTVRDRLGVAAVGERAYVIGGRSGSLVENRNDVAVYDPAKDAWEAVPSMPVKRGDIAVVAYDERIFVFGGETPTVTFDMVHVYNVKGVAWKETVRMPTARHGLGAAVVGDKIFVIGGGLHPGISVSDVNEVFYP
jgi:N-acetylneuraminic acid mutarotase